MTITTYTEGVCGDGAAILRDGVPMSVSEILDALNAAAAREAVPVAYNQVQRDMMKDIITRKLGGNLVGEKLVMDDIHAVTLALINAGFRTAPPAPAVTSELLDAIEEVIRISDRDHDAWNRAKEAITNCRSAAMNGTATPAPAYPERLPCPVRLMPGLLFGKGVPTESMLDALKRRAEYEAELEAMTPEQKAEHDAAGELFKSMLPTPVPAVPREIPSTSPVAAEYVAGWNACRAAMLAAAPAVTPGYRLQPISEYDAMCEYVRDAQQIWNACRAVMLPAAPPEDASNE